MTHDGEINKILSGETRFITSDHPYIDNLEFLSKLEKAYAELEQYEVSSIINSRIMILSTTNKAYKALNDLNNKIELAKKSKDL